MSILEPKQAKTNEKLTETWDMISYAEWPEMWFIHFYKIVAEQLIQIIKQIIKPKVVPIYVELTSAHP